MRINFIIIVSIIGLFLFNSRASADNIWSQWHGPADGTACLPQAPGPDLYCAWHLDLIDPHKDYSLVDNLGFPVEDVYHIGTLLRADEQSLYLKLNADYFRLPANTVWKIDPVTGERLWSTSKSSGEDTTAPRTFQLYDSPQGFKALHVAAFYGSVWNVYDVNTQQEYLISGIADSHSCLGAQILMDKWAWRNNQYRSAHSISYYHGGQLRWWNGTDYEIKIQEPITLIDHAWDDDKCVVFALSGFHVEGTPYDKARYLVLDKNGQILKDVSIADICLPNCPLNWVPYNTDVVMRLSVKGDFIYAVECKPNLEVKLVCRDINRDFAVNAEVSLGMITYSRATSYCIDEQEVYIQFSDKICAYSLDLNTLLWEQPTPHRTLWHSDIQGFGYDFKPSTRNYPQQTIACNGTYIYHTTDNRFQVRRASDGVLVFEHIFTDLPHKRSVRDAYIRMVGFVGDVVLMPDCVLVSSCLDATYLWAFRLNPAANQAPRLAEPENTTLYVNQPLFKQMYINSGVGPYLWSIDQGTDDLVEGYLTVNAFNQLVGWTPQETDVGKNIKVVVKVEGVNGLDIKSFYINVQSSETRVKLVDFGSTAASDQYEAPGFDKSFSGGMYRTAEGPGGLYTGGAGSYCGVEGSGRYFHSGDKIEFTVYNKGTANFSVRPFISFIYKGSYNQYNEIIKLKLIGIGPFMVGGGKTVIKRFTFTDSDAGFYTLVNIVPYVYSGTAADMVIDKIEFIGPADKFIRGDVNDDKSVDVIDVQLCVNVILGTETGQSILSKADVNVDSIVDVVDVQTVVNIIMGG